jgi:23S rRNA (cytosine1962-C5)-methyltransferase
MAGAFLKERCLGRIFAGHPWVYESDIQRVDKPPEDGGEIVARTASGGFVAAGFFNSISKIPIRLYSRTKGEKLDEAFFRRRLENARAFREQTSGLPRAVSRGLRPLSSVFRLVWSEADFLPGLVVDRYDEAWVIQTLTLAMDQRKAMIVSLLKDLFGATAVMERNDIPSREFEGLSPQKGWLAGSGEARRIVTLGRAKMDVDLLEGQKTGEYLDQIANQMSVGALAKGRKVLDCFTYHGGFAIHAALNGAASVEAVDISEDAIAVCRRNAELNGPAQVTWRVANVFDDLNARVKARAQFDLVVLDPPSFTRSRAKLLMRCAGTRKSI